MLERPITELSLADLDQLFSDAETADKRLFAEQRTNLQLVMGEHYVREGSKYWNRIRDNKELTNEQRIKLTKNHTQRVTRLYRNGIDACAPGVGIFPAVDSELAHQKAAELHSAYWDHVKHAENWESKVHTWQKHFVEVGEVACKVFWEPNAGNIVGYEAFMEYSKEAGREIPSIDPQTGDIKQSEVPVYGGKLVFETIPAYNLRRDASSTSMEDSPFLGYIKVVSKNALAGVVKDKQLIAKLDEATQSAFTVYDNNTGRYQNSTGQAIVKEVYFRPCPQAPSGFFYIWCSSFLIAKGPLPYGVFPIVYEGFEEQIGSPRCYSIIRTIRPCQIEINRAASKVAEHQVTLGDDKVYIPANAKLNQGATLPGVRINTFTGMPPQVVPGRTGDHYLPYIEAQINEMYRLAGLEEEAEEVQPSGDPYTDLYRRIRHKKKFSVYGSKFERYLVNVVSTGLKLAKKCAHEAELIPAVGKNEYINIAEFKNSEDLCYRIKIKPQNEDVDSQMGKQLMINHVIQYVGPKLERDDIGKIIRLSPFLNEEQMFQDFTQQYDNARNDILALDRGQVRPLRKHDDHKYMLKALGTRQSQPDYEFLHPVIKQMYDMKIAQHEEVLAEQARQIQMAEAGFIPSGGYAVACDFYTSDPNDPSKTKRLRLPSEALNWLVQKLEAQGNYQDDLEKLSGGTVSDIGAKLNSGGPQQPPVEPSSMGQANPTGETNGRSGLGSIFGGYAAGAA